MGAAKNAKICGDMISALPDELLVAILLLLPIKEAVATMILSKRWRFVWTMLPRLEYLENGDNGDKSKKSIWWFIEKSMELHRAPVLEILLIKLGPGCPSDADVGKCLRKAVDHGVVVLKFKLSWSTDPTRLPKSLYSCETLKELTLSDKILVDFPSSSCLPSLYRLELSYVVYKEEASLVRFLSSCPVLENLKVKRNKNHDNVTKFTVKVPSLQYFLYRNSDYTLFLAGDNVVDTGGSLVIDTPALKDFLITDFSRDSWSFKNVNCLNTANIVVKSFPDIDKSKASLSGVSSLVLGMSDEVFVRCSTIKFPRLIGLHICPHDSDWLKPFLLLLENAPKVKVLVVDNDLSYEDPFPLTWNKPSSIPGCISSSLMIFEYIEYEDREEEEEFLTYILANSKCLNTVTISVRSSFHLEKRELIMEKLRNIPRVSTTSKLLFK